MTPVPGEPPRFDPSRRRTVLLALSLVTVLASFETTVVSTAMPTIIGELQGLPLYSWVFAVYLLTSTISMPLYGRLADLHGRRRILLISIVVFLLGAGACAAARSMPELILARGLQGLGAGGLLPTAITVTADLYRVTERARIQGLFSTLWGTAALLGPLLGAGMTMAFGWRSIFSINLPLGVLSFILVGRNLRESRAARPDPFDVPGAVALAVGMTCLLLSVLQGTEGRALPPLLRLGLGLAGFASLLLFGRLQATREHPLVPPALFARAETAAPYLCGALLGTTIFGVDTFVPLFVQGARGGTAAAAGAVVTPVMLFWALSSSVAARLVLRWGFRATARAGTVIIALGFVALLACAHLDAPVAAISAACAVVGCGLGQVGLSQMLAIQHTAPEAVRGVATSLVPFFRTVGGALGVGALGGLLSVGLTTRLGAAAETVGHLLVRDQGGALATSGGLEAAAVRLALERALLPVFAVLLALALLNVAIAGWFPVSAHDPAGEPAPSPRTTPTEVPPPQGGAD